MASKHAQRRKSRTRSIESLEERRVMSADPLLSGTLQHHGLDSPDSEPPSLVHHQERDADFWFDSWTERDLDALLGEIEQTLASAHGVTGLTTARNNYGLTGAGQTVAVIDSGIAWDHNALGGGFGSSYRVVGGWDFAENDSNPYDDGSAGAHGTHVSGIVGADRSGLNDDGVAPGVDLVGLRVFNDNGEGYFHWVEDALQWVHENRNAFDSPITAVNLSLGTTWNATSVPSWSTLEDEFAQLKADGIFISVSAGNSFPSYDTPGLSYPAASPHVVPVMSLTDGGNLSSFSQRHTSAIAAPGQHITSTVPDYVGNHNGIQDDYASMSGTSMAAPYVAGASVLIREAMQFVGYTGITQDVIFDHMMATASTFFDSATGLNYKRLNLAEALDALMPDDEYGSTAGAAHNLSTVNVAGKSVSGLIGTLSDTDYFRFTAAVTGTVTITADTTHYLAPEWNGAGSVSGSAGEIFTFDVVAGQTYTFGLATDHGIGYYDLDIDLVATVVPPPTMPTGLQAIATSPTQVNLTWDDSQNETTYQVVRWSSETGTVVAANLGADVTSHTVTGLPPGSRQFFQITARNASGAVTTAYQLVTMPQVPPHAPPWLNVTVATPTMVVLTWGDSDGENDYQIARWNAETGTSVVATVPANVTSYTVTGLPPDSRQFFKITARNSAGSAATDFKVVMMPPATPPTIPGALHATLVSPTQVDLTWSDSTGEDYYQVIRWCAEEGTVVAATLAANTTSYSANGLSPSTRYFFRIQAGNSSGGVSTAWELLTTPSGSSHAAMASGIQDPLNTFAVEVSQQLHVPTRDVAIARGHSGIVSQNTLHGHNASQLRSLTELATLRESGRLDAFSQLQSPEMSLPDGKNFAAEPWLDLLAQSSVNGFYDELAGNSELDRFWQNW